MAVIPETSAAPAPGAPRWRRLLTPWRSPADQPAWGRPALLAIAAVAAVAYGWGMAGASVEPFYGAASRSMSESWHDFILAKMIQAWLALPALAAAYLLAAPAVRLRTRARTWRWPGWSPPWCPCPG